MWQPAPKFDNRELFYSCGVIFYSSIINCFGYHLNIIYFAMWFDSFSGKQLGISEESSVQLVQAVQQRKAEVIKEKKAAAAAAGAGASPPSAKQVMN